MAVCLLSFTSMSWSCWSLFQLSEGLSSPEDPLSIFKRRLAKDPFTHKLSVNLNTIQYLVFSLNPGLKLDVEHLL